MTTRPLTLRAEWGPTETELVDFGLEDFSRRKIGSSINVARLIVTPGGDGTTCQPCMSLVEMNALRRQLAATGEGEVWAAWHQPTRDGKPFGARGTVAHFGSWTAAHRHARECVAKVRTSVNEYMHWLRAKETGFTMHPLGGGSFAVTDPRTKRRGIVRERPTGGWFAERNGTANVPEPHDHLGDAVAWAVGELDEDERPK